MCTASGGRNQIDVALTHGLTVFGKSDRPFRALAFGKAVVVAVCVAIPLEQRDDGVAVERLHQVVAQAAFVEPVLGVFGFFVVEPHANPRHQYSLAAE